MLEDAPVLAESIVVVPATVPDGKGGYRENTTNEIYLVPREVYLQQPLPPEAAGIVRQMIRYGSAFGYLPTGSVGIGVQCYLANLRSLRTDLDPT